MKTKNIVYLVIVLIVAFLFVLYTQKNNENVLENSNVSTTTNTTTGTPSPSPAPVSTSTTTTKPVIKNPTPVVTNNYIKIGQKTFINGIYVTPIKVSYDSRCPKDVQCIQAGSVDLGVLLESGSLSQNVIITSGKPFTFNGKQVTLTNVIPSRLSTKVILESEYRFLITVKK